MGETERIQTRIRNAGFCCLLCEACCSGPDNEVRVLSQEIELIAEATGMTCAKITIPYPEWISRDGATFTFGWVLRRGPDGNCIFLKDNQCMVYQYRPHICRTYPFVLNGEEPIISECPGCIAGAATKNTRQNTQDLIRRRMDEDTELENTEKQYQKHNIIAGSMIVFDSSGAYNYAIPPKNYDKNTYYRNCPHFTEKYRRSP
ncbi:MAG: YkgJ family cysteine cluster protein [Methanocalculaceae archaeon]|jgi:Fe-S-cluster containining protein|nr:YkgJ family cysteine cluster protein [Methanocalculaceae archaeon]